MRATVEVKYGNFDGIKFLSLDTDFFFIGQASLSNNKSDCSKEKLYGWRGYYYHLLI